MCIQTITCYNSLYCGFQNGEKSLDICQIYSEAELDKIQQHRRKKLRKQQQQQQLPEGGSDDVTITITDKLSLLATVKMDVMCDIIMGKKFWMKRPCF